MSKSLTELYATTPLFGSNAAAIEQFYERYLEAPDSVPEAWRNYFETLGDSGSDVAHSPIRDDLRQQAATGSRAGRISRKRAGGAAGAT
ncbi:MAG: hypothetical protein AAGE85_17970, partial [Pseudomonadota bacterium]